MTHSPLFLAATLGASLTLSAFAQTGSLDAVETSQPTTSSLSDTEHAVWDAMKEEEGTSGALTRLDAALERMRYAQEDAEVAERARLLELRAQVRLLGGPQEGIEERLAEDLDEAARLRRYAPEDSAAGQPAARVEGMLLQAEVLLETLRPDASPAGFGPVDEELAKQESFYRLRDLLRDARSQMARRGVATENPHLATALHEVEADVLFEAGLTYDSERSAREGLELTEEGTLDWAVLTMAHCRALKELDRVAEIDGEAAERAWLILRRERFPARIASSTHWSIQLSEAFDSRPVLRRRAEEAFGEEYYFELSGSEPEEDPNPIAENGGFF